MSTLILAFRNRPGKALINAQKAKNEAKIIETISMTSRKVNTDEEPGNIVRTDCTFERLDCCKENLIRNWPIS